MTLLQDLGPTARGPFQTSYVASLCRSLESHHEPALDDVGEAEEVNRLNQ